MHSHSYPSMTNNTNTKENVDDVIVFNDLGSTEHLILEDHSPKMRKRRIIATFLVILMMLVFFGMIFFAWPRLPDVAVISFAPDEANPSVPDENGQILTNWIGKLSFKSRNNWDIGVVSLHINAFIPSNMDTPVGFGKADGFVIKSKDETTVLLDFKVPVYQPSSGKPSLLEECMTNSKADLLIKAEIDLKLTHWTGKKIKTSIRKTIDCSLPQLYSIIKRRR